ncbi:MAG: hypothetical protein ACE5OZ_01735 [Candidatus Heimdallarchaeota archaeon]
MQLILEGQIISPIVTRQPRFAIKGCRATIRKPRRRWYGKITTGKPMFPYALICYLGVIELRYSCKAREQAKRKLQQLLKIDQMGRYQSEGLGKIQWVRGRILEIPEKAPRRWPRIQVRKGLPVELPYPVRELIRYALLHDFVHTEKHRSKIYVEVPLDDPFYVEWLKQHHAEKPERFLQVFQKYDRRAATITRRIRSPIRSRYNWKAAETEINFEKLAAEIKNHATHVWKLYEVIYESKELALLNESLDFGHSSLKNHLLLITNLIVQDYLVGKLGSLRHGQGTVQPRQSTVATQRTVEGPDARVEEDSVSKPKENP